MLLLAGTSGFSYSEWKGNFYPAKLPAAEMLRHYAARFPTVEINNTFYRMPAESMLSRWAREVPAGFGFTLKAPQRITHHKRLREAEQEVSVFLQRATALGDKLGPVLFQLPPVLRKDVPRLEDFLALLTGDGNRFAFEFRHASWQDDAVYAVLRARGAMTCIADTDKGDTPLVATADQGYLRLRRTQYDDHELRAWAERVAAQPWARAYVYFKHEDEGLGPQFAQRFMRAWEEVHGAAPPRRASRATPP
jgi:uncharacterized protein YecE (DUF72 family)